MQVKPGTDLCRACTAPSSRFCGRSRSTWKQLAFCPSCLCCNARARQRPLQHIISSLSVHTERSTSRIGFTGEWKYPEVRMANDADTRHGLRYFTEDTVDPIAIVAGLVQTALYADFFYIYFTKSVMLLRGLGQENVG